jgi:uncharacterized membrane protein
LITTTTQLTGNSRITYRDQDTIIGEVLTTTASTGHQLYVALAHDWDGDSDEYDPIVVDTTDDMDQAAASVRKRYEAHLHSLRCLGITVTTTAELAPSEFDPRAAYDALNPKQRAAMRNVLGAESQYRNGAVPARAAYSRVATMDALTTRGLLERQVSGLPLQGSGFTYGYRLTESGRLVAQACEDRSIKLAHPADAGDPFAGMGTPEED